MQPSEFWGLPVSDWWMEFDAKVIEHRRMQEISGGGGKGKAGGGFSSAEWDKARKLHKEKMNGRT